MWGRGSWRRETINRSLCRAGVNEMKEKNLPLSTFFLVSFSLARRLGAIPSLKGELREGVAARVPWPRSHLG